jgi:hypothetical protein
MESITTRLIGGLGNQMFQYAAGRSLSLRLNFPLQLDASELNKQTYREFGLHAFQIDATLRAQAQPKKVHGLLRFAKWTGISTSTPIERTYKEPHFHFDPGFLTLHSPCTLEGYWQSEKYFSEHAKTIREEFTPKDRSPAIQAIEQELQAQCAVSVHIRRGDYIANAHTAQYHGSCQISYYQKAMDHIKGIHPESLFYIFSDDPEWVKKSFPQHHTWNLIESESNQAPWIDMWLMSRCKHHIIANSSYSWWGAWLNQSTTKSVIAPKKWFNDSPNDTRDLIPPTWMQLD